MKRFYSCTAIIAVIIFLCIGSLWTIKKANNKLFSLADKTAYEYEQDGSTQSALNDLEEYMEEYYITVSYAAKTDLLNDIYTNVNRLRSLLEKDSDEFMSELENVKFKAMLIYKSQFPHIYSIL